MSNLMYIIIITIGLVFLLVCMFIRMRRVKKAVCILASAGLTAAVLLFWFFPSWDFPETTGPYDPAFVRFTFVDENRIETYRSDGTHRWIEVGFWYPHSESSMETAYPLILFSHGAFGIQESNESLYRELASHGFVVCAVNHTFQSLRSVDADGNRWGLDPGFRRQVLAAGDSTEEKRAQLYEYFLEWMEIRMGDIHFVLDTIVRLTAAEASINEGVFQRIDPTQIGVMGHSLGGSAALGIGRSRADIGAVVALESPFMADVVGLRAGGFDFLDDEYPVPLLHIYTDASWHILSSSPQYAQNHRMLKEGRPSTHAIYVQGAGHMTLTDLVYSMPPLCLLFGQDLFFPVDVYAPKMSRTILDFFDVYLKGHGTYVPLSFE